MKKRILSLILLLCTVILLAVPVAASGLSAMQQSTKPSTYYHPSNGYFYQLNRMVSDSVDSFEAWIKVPVGSFGGPIFANIKGHTEWNVDIYGRFGFKWMNTEAHTFSDSPNLADGKWHHVALVRTNTEFTYYLDGTVAGVHEAKTTPNSVTHYYNIGAIYIDANQDEFEGLIRQVTIYDGAISQAQILQDMNNTDISEDSGNARLIGNWNLGDYWTERFVESTVADSLVAEIHTMDKFVEADYSFGEYDYTIAIFPDIQIMTNYNPTRLNNQIQWLVDNKEELNVKFAAFVGDLSDFGQKEYLYEVAANAMSKLDNKIPYCFVPGNHDYDDNAKTRSQVYFNKHFPVSKHSQLPGFGGCFEEGSMANTYYTFDVGNGVKYLVLNLEFMPRMSVLMWANIIVEAHPDHRVIMNTHAYLDKDGNFKNTISVGNESNGGTTIFNELMVNHPNIFLGVNGNDNSEEPVYRIDTGVHGNKIMSMLLDVQASRYKDDTILDVFMLIRVNEKNKTMSFMYYSPAYDKVYNIQGQFQLSFADPLNPTIGE